MFNFDAVTYPILQQGPILYNVDLAKNLQMFSVLFSTHYVPSGMDKTVAMVSNSSQSVLEKSCLEKKSKNLWKHTNTMLFQDTVTQYYYNSLHAGMLWVHTA